MENIVNEPALKYDYLSPEEYLAAEGKALEKHELMNGKIITMTWVPLKHNQIVSTNLAEYLLITTIEQQILLSDIYYDVNF